MRVSPVGWSFDDEDRVLREAERTAAVTHNHREGIRGAQAAALAVFLARTGATKSQIRERVQDRFGYSLRRTVDEIRITHRFDVSCEGTVPESIRCFLESHDVESAIRLAVSLGGDADTLAAITGAIAEGFYGSVPDPIEREVRGRLTPDLLEVVDRFRERFGPFVDRSTKDRFLGCLLGLAVGDAIGTTVEFATRGSFAPVVDMVGGGPSALPAGAWTDDTSMALCLAESLLQRGFDPADQMQRFRRWRDEGYMSSTGRCFDIGRTVAGSIRRFERTGDPLSGPIAPDTAGNGCIMRLSPVPMFFWPDRDRAVEFSGESARTTHGARECVDACRLLGSMLVAALDGSDRETILRAGETLNGLSPRLRAVARGDYRAKSAAEIRGTGYVVDSLEAALWSFATTSSFPSAVLRAVNLGEDADTTAAVCGQLAGAHYGSAGIPPSWKERVAKKRRIEDLAVSLYDRESPERRSGSV
jgi:ADP-ribosyl-[dinitrogen reductase] hydrolase